MKILILFSIFVLLFTCLPAGVNLQAAEPSNLGIDRREVVRHAVPLGAQLAAGRVVTPGVGKEAHLYWPSTRPPWCDKDVHFCISASDSIDKKLSPYAISLKYIRPAKKAYLKVEDRNRGIGESCGARSFPEEVVGRMVERFHYKLRKMVLVCQPLPIDNAPAFHFQLEPGKTHPVHLDAFAVYPIIFSAPRDVLTELKKPVDRTDKDVDRRPIVDCLDLAIRNHTPTQGKTCVGGRGATQLTVRGIIVVHARRAATGEIEIRKGGDAYFRCVMAVQDIFLEDVDLLGCKHGVQGRGGKVWTLNRVKMLDCSITGNGKAHCIYTASPKESLSLPHEKLIVIDSYLQTCGGHVIKTNSDVTIVKNTVLVEGKGKGCDTGNAIHNNAAMSVSLENVIIEQHESRGNAQIFSVGSRKIERCRGKQNGEWTVKNVTITDTELGGKPTHRYKEHCPLGPGKWTDLGGNTINGKPLFDKRGVPFTRR